MKNEMPLANANENDCAVTSQAASPTQFGYVYCDVR